jgi:hypothetical protein
MFVEVLEGEDRRRRWQSTAPGPSRLQLRHETAVGALEVIAPEGLRAMVEGHQRSDFGALP